MHYVWYLVGLAAMAACPVVTWFFVHAPAGVAGVQANAVVAAPVAAAPVVAADAAARAGDGWRRRGAAGDGAADAGGGSGGGDCAETAEKPADVPAKEAEAGPEGVLARILAASPWIVMAWWGGVVVLSLRLAVGAMVLRRWRRGARRWRRSWSGGRGGYVSGWGWPGLRRVYIGAVRQAMAVGCWRPMVLLPMSLVSAVPVEVLEAVIAHELSHIRRLDLWVNLAQRVLETLLFYHPAVWWLSGRARAEREICCDEAAVAATGQRLEYATSLALVAAHSLGMSVPACRRRWEEIARWRIACGMCWV